MSRARAHARAAREAEQARERAAAQRARTRRTRLGALRPTLPALPNRRRRYGQLPTRVLLGLGFGWLVAQWVLWQLTPDVRARCGLALVSLLALPLIVVLTPSKGTR